MPHVSWPTPEFMVTWMSVLSNILDYVICLFYSEKNEYRGISEGKVEVLNCNIEESEEREKEKQINWLGISQNRRQAWRRNSLIIFLVLCHLPAFFQTSSTVNTFDFTSEDFLIFTVFILINTFFSYFL